MQPTYLSCIEDAKECAEQFILMAAALDGVVVVCDFEVSEKLDVLKASKMILEIINGSHIAEESAIASTVNGTGAHFGRKFTITATKF